MAFNYDKVIVPPHDPHVIVRDSKPGIALGHMHNIHGHAAATRGDMVRVTWLAGDYQWKHKLSLPRPHARALAYLLLLETAGPLERAAVIADARAEGIEIGGITSPT